MLWRCKNAIQPYWDWKPIPLLGMLCVYQRWDDSDSGIGIGIGIGTSSRWAESELELNRLVNWNRTTVSGIGIGIGIESAGIVPSLVYTQTIVECTASMTVDLAIFMTY